MLLARLRRHWPGIHPKHALAWLTALGMAVAFGMLALGGDILIDARAEAWRQAEQASTNLLLALSRDIARNITVYDLSLQGLIDGLARPDIDRIEPETRQMTLFGRAASAEYLGAMVAVDPDGNVTADSTSIRPHALNIANRDFFLIQKEHPDAGLVISRTFHSRLRDGDLGIAISRRINRQDGSFGGVVSGSLRLAYFANLFGRLDLGSQGAVTLFRDDGWVITRQPFRDSDIDRDLGNTDSFRRYTQSNSGSFQATSTLDGTNRFYTFRHITGLPLIISVAVAVDDINAAWWSRAVGIGSVMIGLCAATVALCLLFRREVLLRLKAEAALIDAARELSVMASTDALTGLANRRAFDERLQEEWDRSRRTETPLALLMLDADFFKSFNDQYGHPAGDRALRLIASGIAECMFRPADTGARYGGEEFAALLPDTELAGACIVAERIRAAVAALALPHAGNPTGFVTISVGVASVWPCPDLCPAALLAAADVALYDAKHAGRNRVCADATVAAIPTRMPQRMDLR